MVNFLYLIQTEGNIPESYSFFRHKNTLILSYKENTDDTDIFYPDSTWTQGRNKLYNFCQTHHIRFRHVDYFVYLDFDLTIDLNMINKFENQITELGYKYPIVFPRIGGSNRGPSKWGLGKIEKKGLENLSFKYQTVDWFDGCFNAFHKDSINQLFPLEEKLDKESWWYSQMFLVFKSNYIFKNKIVQLNEIIVDNQLHSKYPRHMKNVRLRVEEYLKENSMEDLTTSDGFEILPTEQVNSDRASVDDTHGILSAVKKKMVWCADALQKCEHVGDSILLAELISKLALAAKAVTDVEPFLLPTSSENKNENTNDL
tara:strand:- start:1891 stop:2835 length:945 start_codon:yes stop_codon:yes gene_type:complete